MFDDLVATCQMLENMLSDAQESYGDLHPEDVAEILRNCELKAMELAREILASRRYVHEVVLPNWVTTASGSDAGMPPGEPPTGEPPPVTRDGMDIS